MSSYVRNSLIDIEGRIPASRTGDIKIIFESIHLGAQKEVIHPAMHRPICYGQRVEAGTKQGELLLLSLNDSSIIRYTGSPSEKRAFLHCHTSLILFHCPALYSITAESLTGFQNRLASSSSPKISHLRRE